MGSTIAICGTRVGDGQAVKLVNQLLCSVHLVAAAEALTFAKALGLDPHSVLTILETGAAASFMLSERGPRMLAEEVTTAGSTIDIFRKDSALVLAAAADRNLTLPVTESARSSFERAGALGLGRSDDSAVIKIYEENPRDS